DWEINRRNTVCDQLSGENHHWTYGYPIVNGVDYGASLGAAESRVPGTYNSKSDIWVEDFIMVDPDPGSVFEVAEISPPKENFLLVIHHALTVEDTQKEQVIAEKIEEKPLPYWTGPVFS